MYSIFIFYISKGNTEFRQCFIRPIALPRNRIMEQEKETHFFTFDGSSRAQNSKSTLCICRDKKLQEGSSFSLKNWDIFDTIFHSLK